jgi:hypothetical protein
MVLISGIFWVWSDARQMQPNQYYAWDGWAWVLFLPDYATGTLVALWLLGRSLFKVARLRPWKLMNLVGRRRSWHNGTPDKRAAPDAVRILPSN